MTSATLHTLSRACGVICRTFSTVCRFQEASKHHPDCNLINTIVRGPNRFSSNALPPASVPDIGLRHQLANVLIASVRSIALVSREEAPSFASAPFFNRVNYFFRIKAESECGLILHSCFDIVRILLFPQRMFPIC